MNNDIALLKVKTPFNINGNDYINRVCIPSTSNYNTDHKQAEISGWGDTQSTIIFVPFLFSNRLFHLVDVTGNNLPAVLQRADIGIWNENECSIPWGFLYKHETMVCAWSATTATCVGDSGGPIYVNDGGKMVQVGISSFCSTSGCLHPTVPVVFSRVSNYIDWINHKIATE